MRGPASSIIAFDSVLVAGVFTKMCMLSQVLQVVQQEKIAKMEPIVFWSVVLSDTCLNSCSCDGLDALRD